MILFCPLWIEVRDDAVEEEDDEQLNCECSAQARFSGRYFLPNVVVKIFSQDGLKVIESDLEECIAQKFLELGRVRPVYRFQISNLYLSVIQLESFLQFGKGEIFKPVVKLRRHEEPHPVNESLVEVELETEPRQGMSIPFPETHLDELRQILESNRKLLPQSLQSDGHLVTFVKHKIFETA